MQRETQAGFTSRQQSRLFLLIGGVILVVVVASVLKMFTPPTVPEHIEIQKPPPIKGTTDPTGGFTVGYSPSMLKFKAGSTGTKTVTIMVVPETASFAESVSVQVEDILKDTISIFNQQDASIQARFTASTIEKSNYKTGVKLTVSVAKPEKGNYAVVGVAMAGGVKKPIVIPVIVE